jgi:hypothetical protein
MVAFGQVRRPDGLADVEPIFNPDVAARNLGLLESVVGGESGHHVGMCGNEDPRLTLGISNRVSMRALVLILRYSFSGVREALDEVLFEDRLCSIFGIDASRSLR